LTEYEAVERRLIGETASKAMKPTLLLALTTLTTAAVLPNTAAADRGDKVLAAVGGFIGGVIVGTHLDRDSHHHYHDAPVMVESCPPPRFDRHPPRRHGYWEETTVRVWVPGRTVWTVDHCGRSVRRYEPGHYEYRRERVWVETRGRGRW
jgi:hypothetical protein